MTTSLIVSLLFLNLFCGVMCRVKLPNRDDRGKIILEADAKQDDIETQFDHHGWRIQANPKTTTRKPIASPPPANVWCRENVVPRSCEQLCHNDKCEIRAVLILPNNSSLFASISRVSLRFYSGEMIHC